MHITNALLGVGLLSGSLVWAFPAIIPEHRDIETLPDHLDRSVESSRVNHEKPLKIERIAHQESENFNKPPVASRIAKNLDIVSADSSSKDEPDVTDASEDDIDLSVGEDQHGDAWTKSPNELDIVELPRSLGIRDALKSILAKGKHVTKPSVKVQMPQAGKLKLTHESNGPHLSATQEGEASSKVTDKPGSAAKKHNKRSWLSDSADDGYEPGGKNYIKGPFMPLTFQQPSHDFGPDGAGKAISQTQMTQWEFYKSLTNATEFLILMNKLNGFFFPIFPRGVILDGETDPLTGPVADEADTLPKNGTSDNGDSHHLTGRPFPGGKNQTDSCKPNNHHWGNGTSPSTIGFPHPRNHTGDSKEHPCKPEHHHHGHHNGSATEIDHGKHHQGAEDVRERSIEKRGPGSNKKPNKVGALESNVGLHQPPNITIDAQEIAIFNGQPGMIYLQRQGNITACKGGGGSVPYGTETNLVWLPSVYYTDGNGKDRCLQTTTMFWTTLTGTEYLNTYKNGKAHFQTLTVAGQCNDCYPWEVQVTDAFAKTVIGNNYSSVDWNVGFWGPSLVLGWNEQITGGDDTPRR